MRSASVGLSVRLYISKTMCPDLGKFSVHVMMSPVAVARSPFDDNAICYVLLLWMTSCFHIMGEIHIVTAT